MYLLPEVLDEIYKFVDSLPANKCNKTTLKNFIEEIKSNKKFVAPNPEKTPTYASVATPESARDKLARQTKKKFDSGNTIFVKGDQKAIKEKLTNSKLHPSHIRTCTDGVNFKLPATEEANNSLQALGLKQSIVKRHNPTLRIRSVGLNKEDLASQLILKNNVKEEDIKILFPLKIKDSSHLDWVIRVSPDKAYDLIKKGTYLGLRRHKTELFFQPKYCRHCESFGHSSSQKHPCQFTKTSTCPCPNHKNFSSTCPRYISATFRNLEKMNLPDGIIETLPLNLLTALTKLK